MLAEMFVTLPNKTPPIWSDDRSFESWKAEIEMWLVITDIQVNKRAPTFVLTLQGRKREVAKQLPIGDLNHEDGVTRLLAKKSRLSYCRKRFQGHYAQRGGVNHGKNFKSEGKNPKDNQGYVTTCRICGSRNHWAVCTKDMNNELVNRFNRKTFGIKNTEDLTAESGVFKIQYYYTKNNCTARTCYGKR